MSSSQSEQSATSNVHIKTGEKIEEIFLNLAKRFENKKNVYNVASGYLKMIDMCVFTIPLLLLQIMNAILPVSIPDEDTKTLKTITTIVAAVSAGMIGLQARLRLQEMTEKYSNAASVYSMLKDEGHLRMQTAKCKTESEEEMRRLAIVFLEYAKNLETKATASIPILPRFLHKLAFKANLRDRVKKEKFVDKMNNLINIKSDKNSGINLSKNMQTRIEPLSKVEGRNSII